MHSPPQSTANSTILCRLRDTLEGVHCRQGFCLDQVRRKAPLSLWILARDVLMAYVPSHRADVFISYSHADDFGWIDLSLNLAILLMQVG